METGNHLESALARLEAAVEAITKRAAEREADLGRALEGSKQEAAQLRQENAALKAAMDDTSRRLDGAIGRLQGLLAVKN